MSHRKGTNLMDPKPIILLDLMYTLIENMPDRKVWFARHGTSSAAYASWIPQERMRLWLVDLLKASGCRVILVTARGDQHRVATLHQIVKATGWLPDESFFNQNRLPPPVWKHIVLHKYLFPKNGESPATRYLGIESNPATRTMYANHGIPSLPVPQEPWTSLPAL